MTRKRSSRRAAIGAIGWAALTSVAGCIESPPEVATGELPNETITPDETATETDAEVTDSPTATEIETATATGASEVTTVAVGPDGRLRFDPETVEISVGDTVRWTFESAGHNVTTKPGASERISIPDGAEPFASYEGDQHYSINEVGTTYEHTFEVPGEYVYVCEPHADQGMVGTVQVAEG